MPIGGKLSFQWSALSGPAPVTFSNLSGGSTQAVFKASGTYVLQLAASDSQLTGTGSVSITVNPAGTNQPPVVSITADNTAITLPTNNVTLTGAITDDGLPGGPISTQWSQVSGPVAATITQLTPTSVNVTFTTAGVYTFKLTASDGQLSSSATINITVTTAGGNQPPAVTAGANQTITLPQNTASLRGDARDDGLPSGSTLSVIWSALSGPAPVVFIDPNALVTQATFGAAGVYVLQLLASDTQLQSTARVTITVLSSIAPPPPPPVVSFAGLTDGQEITKPTPIIGSVSAGSWKLEYSLLDGSGNPTTFVTFASGVAPVTNSTLGTFDPTVLLNGQYVMRFSSTDNAGQTATATSTVDVSRNTKVGNFTLSFNDLSVPLPGLPITVTRNYDSRDKRVGDFGLGWTLSVANVRVQKTGGAIGTGWDEEQNWSGFFPTYCLQPIKNHTVSVTFPDGKVYKFQAVNSPQCQQLVPIDAPQIGFTQIPTGSATAGATLTPIGDTDLLLDAGIPGPVNLITAEVEFADFTQFQLNTAEGYKYVLDQKLGATSMTDPNGNTLTINAGGMIHSGGESVPFTRDPQGRITQISDPNGNTLHYAYNGAGDLASVTDRTGNVTSFNYDSTHLLMDVIDPRGVQAVRNSYDEAGRLLSSTDANGNTTTFTHQVEANRETLTDRLGNPTLYEYDDDGNVIHVTDPLGNTISYTYDANDNQLTQTDALGHTLSFTYDAAGNRLTEKDPLGNVTRYSYNDRRQPLTVIDSRGGVTTSAYDGSGNLLSQTDPAGKTTSYTYNTQGQMLTMTDPLSAKTTFTYDANGRVSSQTDGLGNLISFTYDTNGNQLTQSLSRTKSDGSREVLITQYQCDANNRRIKTTYPDGTFTRVVFNAMGKRSDSIDALGRTTHYDYDDNGRLIKTTYPDQTSESITYDADGHRLTFTDRAARVMSYLYDRAGKLVKTTYPDQTSTQMVYDAAGRTLQTIDALNQSVSFGYDDAGRQTSITDALNHTIRFAYDAAGNQISVTDALNHTTGFLYDAVGRLIKTNYPDQTADLISYDAMGRPLSKTDQAGKQTGFGYDPLGRLTTVTQFLNGAPLTTSYSYDEAGDRISQTDANGHTTKMAYDGVGRRISLSLPMGMRETFGYDAVGNLISKTDFNGHTTTFQYDAMNRLTSKTADVFFSTGACAGGACGATQVSYTYNTMGRRLSMTDASGHTQYTYDGWDRLLTKQTPFGTLTYTYDAAGNILSLQSSNPGGASMTYSYDALNRLHSATDVSGVTSYTYDAAGNLGSFAYPNGVLTNYSYNALNRLTSMQSTCATGVGCGAPGSVLAGYTYTLVPSGNRVSVAELNGRNVQYGYDDLYRLTSEAVSGAPSGTNGAISYTYDAVGNRVLRNSTLPAISATGLLNYDSNDRISTDPYDANGNLLNAGVGSNLFDFENRLVSAGGVSIVYDGEGNRVSETVAGVTTNYLIADLNTTGFSQLMEELQGGSVSRVYSYGLALINERQTIAGTASTSFYGYDGHGSVRSLTNEAGAVTDSYDYDAFGNLVNRAGATPNNYLFAGEQFDSALGVYYNRARYYDQRTGRFWSMDPKDGDDQDPVSLHRYLYAANNPVNFTDPSGQSLSNFFYGRIVHREIGNDFVAEDPLTHLSDRAINTILGTSVPGGSVRPDLTDLGTQKAYEIKPTNSAPLGYIQLAGYLLILNKFDPLKRTWSPGESYSPPFLIDLDGLSKALVSPPVGGVIIYEVLNLKEMLAVVTLAAALMISELEFSFALAPALAF